MKKPRRRPEPQSLTDILGDLSGLHDTPAKREPRKPLDLNSPTILSDLLEDPNGLK